MKLLPRMRDHRMEVNKGQWNQQMHLSDNQLQHLFEYKVDIDLGLKN